MELKVQKEEYDGMNIHEIGCDLEISILLQSLQIDLDIQPYDMLKDIVGEMAKYYTKYEMMDIMRELVAKFWD